MAPAGPEMAIPLGSQLGTDIVTITVGQGDAAEKIVFHKKILCQRVEYFNKMFNGSYVEGNSQTAHLPEDDLDAFKLLARFMERYRMTDLALETPDLALDEMMRLQAGKLIVDPRLEDPCDYHQHSKDEACPYTAIEKKFRNTSPGIRDLTEDNTRGNAWHVYALGRSFYLFAPTWLNQNFHAIRSNLQTLRALLLTPSSADSVIVAVDFERPDYISKGFQHGFTNTQVGLAILDVQDLSPTSKITAFNYFTGDDAYFEEESPRYRWGTAEKIPIQNMLSMIQDCLSTYQDRNIVLVGHGLPGDLAAIRALGFDLQKNKVVVILDTYLLAQDLQMGEFSLRKLLIELNCPCRMALHNAANDANFALRALLLLGIKAIEVEEGVQSAEVAESNECVKRIRLFWWTAMAGLLSKRERNEWRRYFRRRAVVNRTLEEQDAVREERRKRRQLIDAMGY
ncbi:hypothetical protein VTL71DRAFT_7276 [Oculimacula yallundae]|uniref:BTB domain-containing protein n=1 Tax=Oculimacula yallundae TaxID=86028 RepID=A0ABR4BYV2_9HELO